jgi:hypothetical protein
LALLMGRDVAHSAAGFGALAIWIGAAREPS